MRFRLFILGGLAMACGDAQPPQFSVSIEATSPADPEAFKLNDEPVPYANGGTFYVRVIAQAASSVTVKVGSAPLRSSLQILDELAVDGAIVTASGVLMPDPVNSRYLGVSILAWPPAGQVQLLVAAAGSSIVAPITIADPLPSSRPAIAITEPSDAAEFEPGARVPMSVTATYPATGAAASGVALNFQIAATPTVPVAALPNSTLIVPTTATTDMNGEAKVTLVMPQLGAGGVLYIEAAAGSARSAGISLFNP